MKSLFCPPAQYCMPYLLTRRPAVFVLFVQLLLLSHCECANNAEVCAKKCIQYEVLQAVLHGRETLQGRSQSKRGDRLQYYTAVRILRGFMISKIQIFMCLSVLNAHKHLSRRRVMSKSECSYAFMRSCPRMNPKYAISWPSPTFACAYRNYALM